MHGAVHVFLRTIEIRGWLAALLNPIEETDTGLRTAKRPSEEVLNWAPEHLHDLLILQKPMVLTHL